MIDSSPQAGPVLIIIGSARAGGNTAFAVGRLCARLDNAPMVVDLAAARIDPFTYDRHDDRDDFRFVIDQMLAHDRVVFATPVYWYAMSGLMKTFFDRLTDLLLAPENRPLGRALVGRDIWLLATGTDPLLPSGFEEPFARTAAYFDMKWRDAVYLRARGDPPLEEGELARVDQLALHLKG